MSLSLAQIATRFGCQVSGEPDVVVTHVAALQNATRGGLSFLANPRYRRYLTETSATAVILRAGDAAGCPTDALICDNPYALYARVAALLHPLPPAQTGVHAAAVVAASAQLGEDVSIAAGAVVEAGARLGARCVIGPGCVVGTGAVLGEDCRLTANVTICHHVRLGARVTVHAASVIGADGFGFARADEGWLKVPQVGTVIVGDDVDIGASTTVDRGAVGDTVIDDGVKLDNQIQIGHNVHIGSHTIVAACSGVSGSTTIGKRCMIGGAVGFVGHLDITDDVVITGQTMVNRSISKAGVYSSALPMDDARRWRRNSARFRQLDELARTVKTLDKKLKRGD